MGAATGQQFFRFNALKTTCIINGGSINTTSQV